MNVLIVLRRWCRNPDQRKMLREDKATDFATDGFHDDSCFFNNRWDCQTFLLKDR